MNSNNPHQNFAGDPAAMQKLAAAQQFNSHSERMAGAAPAPDFRAQKEYPASSIATAEATLIAAMVLATRVQGVIDRLMGVETFSEAFGFGKDTESRPPVLSRLRTLAIATDDAIGRGNAALDRLDIELN